MRRGLKLSLVALSSLSGVSAKTETCDLDCNNRGTCKFGYKDHATLGGINNVDILPWAEKTSIDGMYCECDPGYTGVTCEIEHEICSDDSNNSCFNGGTCLQMYAADNGKWESRCDCTTATKKDENNQLTRYAGEFCQYEETTSCGHELFCTNNGECKDMGILSTSKCICPDGFKGPRCEYKVDNEDEIPCDLGCQNGGQCSIGMKSWVELKMMSKNPMPQFLQEMSEAGFMHCICPAGYTGLLCDIKYEQCQNNHLCFFGSTCAEDGSCDCTSAYTSDTSYAGSMCEYPSTTRCPTADGQHPGDAFCTNNGICHDKGSHRGCYCPQGFSGPRCEQEGQVAKPCDLECKNGGTCQHGVKFHEFGEIMSLNKRQSKLTIDGMYCSCPSVGFIGVQCEIPVESCYVDGHKDSHICLHGAKCRKDGKDDQGKPKHTCDCSTTTTVDDDGTKLPFAGKFCEYRPTDVCLEDGVADFGLTDHFCTNDGNCKEIVKSSGEAHKGCDCPDGFMGDHCEIVQLLEMTKPPTEEPNHSSSNHHPLVVFLFMLVLGSFVSALAVFVYIVTKQLIQKANDDGDQFTKDFEPTPPETEVGEDGEMENIEII